MFTNYTGALPAFSSGNWLVSGLGSGASIRDVSAAPSGSTLLLNLFSTATLAVAHQGPVALAPAGSIVDSNRVGPFLLRCRSSKTLRIYMAYMQNDVGNYLASKWALTWSDL